MIYDNDTMRYYFSWLVCLALGAVPLMFVPYTQDFYDTNKWMLLQLVTLGVFLAWLISGLIRGHYPVSVSRATLGLLGVSIASLASLTIVSTNKIEALMIPLGPVTFVSLTVLSLLSPAWIEAKSSKRLLWSLLCGAAVLAVSTVYQWAGMGKMMFPGVAFMSDPIWTPVGSLAGSASIFFILLPLAISHGLKAIKEKNETEIAALSIITLVLLVGLCISIWQLIPRAALAFLPIRYGWVIMLEIFKNPLHTIFGFGAENFLTAFSLGRPAGIIASELWNTRFTTNVNTLLHVTTIYGLMGTVALIYFLKNLVCKPLLWSLIVLLVVPPNFSVFILIYALIILFEHSRGSGRTVVMVLDAVWARTILLTFGFLLTGLALYGLGRVYASEYVFYKSITAIQEKRGTDAYNLLYRAIQLLPNITRYHITYSQTNIALASATRDRDLMAQLVQQAIQEAKFAVHLNSKSSTAWENLARTYQQLTGVAPGADSWATTAFEETIHLDPVNPVLALDLGSVLVGKLQYSEAITQFRRATALKPDYVNAWYSLSNAYSLNGDQTAAQKALDQAKRLAQ